MIRAAALWVPRLPQHALRQRMHAPSLSLSRYFSGEESSSFSTRTEISPSREARRAKRAHLREAWGEAGGISNTAGTIPPPPINKQQNSNNNNSTTSSPNSMSSHQIRRQAYWKQHVQSKGREGQSRLAVNHNTPWPKGHKQFLKKLDEYLCDTTLPLFAPLNRSVYDSHDSMKDGRVSVSPSPLLADEASQRFRIISLEIIKRAPDMGVGMIAKIFKSIGHARDVASVQYWRKNRELNINKQYDNMDQVEIWNRVRKDLHPAMMQLLTHFVRLLNAEGAAVRVTATTPVTAAGSSILGTQNPNTHQQPHRVGYREQALEDVSYGLRRAGVRWRDLQHLGDSLLTAMINTLNSTSSAADAAAANNNGVDMSSHCLALLYPATLSSLGRMGLSWYSIPPSPLSMRSNIVQTYENILRDKLRMLTRQQSYVKRDLASSSSSSSSKNKGGMRDILRAFSDIGLSLRPEEIPASLSNLVHKCVQMEAPVMTANTLAETLSLLAKTSSRGMHQLPQDTLDAFYTRLTQVHPELQPGKRDGAPSAQHRNRSRDSSNNYGVQDILWALGVCGGSDQWSTMTQSKRHMVLDMTCSAIARSSNPQKMLAVCSLSLSRMGVQLSLQPSSQEEEYLVRLLLELDLVTAVPNSAVNSNNTSNSACPTDVPTGSSSGDLPLQLLAMAKLFKNALNDKYDSNSINHMEALRTRLNTACDVLTGHLETGTYNERHLMNGIWSLGELGKHWNQFPVRLQEAIKESLSHTYERRSDNGDSNDINNRNNVGGTYSAMDDDEFDEYISYLDHPDAATDINDISAYGYPLPSSSGGSNAEERHSPTSSTLSHLSSSSASLDSPMGKVASFRELLFPNSAELSQGSIYNWLGAISNARIPFHELPEVFITSLLVALTEDLSLQGPSTVAHMAELLCKCNMYIPTVNTSNRVNNDEIEVNGVNGYPLPHYLADVLVLQMAKKVVSLNHEYLCRLIGSLAGTSTDGDNVVPLAKNMPLLECGETNTMLSRRVCKAVTDACMQHVTAAQDKAQQVPVVLDMMPSTDLASSSAYIAQQAFDAAIITTGTIGNHGGMFTNDQLLQLVTSIEKITFCVISDNTGRVSQTLLGEIQTMHLHILKVLVGLSDVQLMQLISSHEGNSSKLLGLCKYLDMPQEHALQLLELQGLLSTYDTSYDYDNDIYKEEEDCRTLSRDSTYGHRGGVDSREITDHAQTALTAFPMLAKEALNLSSRLLRIQQRNKEE